MGARTIGLLAPAFVRHMDEIKQLLQYAFVTQNRLTIPVSAPGSAGMECVFVNLLEPPGDKAIVCQNGVFGGRMKENVERCGAKAVLVQDDRGKPVDPAKVEAVFKANADAKLLAFVHAETSTGAVSDVATLAALAHQYGCLVVVDSMTGLHEALVMLQEEGLEHTWARHAWHHEAFAAGVEAMGLSFVVDKPARLPQLNSISVPAGINETQVRARLLADYNLEIGAGLGALAGKVWRIGLMGESACKRNVLLCLGALDAVLMDMKAPIHGGAAVAAALVHYASG